MMNSMKKSLGVMYLKLKYLNRKFIHTSITFLEKIKDWDKGLYFDAQLEKTNDQIIGGKKSTYILTCLSSRSLH